MVRIVDVAKAAGVSASTVSHVLSRKRSISAETRARVLNAIAELGYEPNPNAQALRGTKLGIIGFIASNITEFFVTQIIQGAERVTRERNAYIVFASAADFDFDLKEAFRFLKRRHIDGLILSYGISQRLVEDMFDRHEIPVTTVNMRLHGDIPSVMPDNLEGGLMAVRHLVARGAGNLAMIAGPRDRIASRERVLGFLQGCRSAELAQPESQHVYYGDFSPASGSAGLGELLRLNPGVDGIFCANDFMAAGAMNEASRLGLAVPERLKILGFDNREFTAFWPTPISTFAQPLQDMGQLSAEILFDLIDGKELQSTDVKLHSSLIQRQST
jgi:LacI family transcriptional regulator